MKEAITTVDEIFGNFFIEYCHVKNKDTLTFVKTSGYREGNIISNPHAIKGNAIDITLRKKGYYAPLREYKELFAYMVEHWPYRAGADLTETVTKKECHPNVHIHADLGANRPAKQKMPYFFIEDNGAYQKSIKDKKEL